MGGNPSPCCFIKGDGWLSGWTFIVPERRRARVSCPRAEVEADVGILGTVLWRKTGTGAGSGQLHYLDYRGAIYLCSLTCFGRPGELCCLEN